MKIQSLKEADLKQQNILDYLNSDSFKDKVSQKVLSVTLDHMDDKLGDYEFINSRPSRLERLREEQAMLLREDQRVQAELEIAKSESNRLEEILRQKQLEVQELRERRQQGGKATLEEKTPKDTLILP